MISGATAGTAAVGLILTASDTTVQGLAIDSFQGDGVDVDSASNDFLTDLFIGVSPTGSRAGNAGNGVAISGASTGDVIGGTSPGAGDVISGNGKEGISILGSAANSNLVEGNVIGTNVAGTAVLGNGLSGVFIGDGSSLNTIGGAATGAGNLISGNDTHGVDFSGASHNVVQGDLIGTNAGGTAALGNTDSGVLLENSADNNLVGGAGARAGNVISGNHLRGVHVTGGSSGNLVEGNSIGTNAAGTAVIGNLDSGVLIDTGSQHNIIGGTTSGCGNVIAGNGYYGVHLTIDASDNLVLGNLIGTNSAGSSTLGNALDGVFIDDGAAANTIGGAGLAGNTISYNGHCGITLDGAGQDNMIESDVIEYNGFGQPTAGWGDGVAIVDSSFTWVVACAIESNRDWGVHATGSSNLTLSADTFLNNGLGMILIV
jgi:titin